MIQPYQPLSFQVYQANIYFNSRAPFSSAMNSGICPKCGLPKELCICEEVAKEQQRISVKVSRRRYGKEVTVVDGLDPYEIDLEDLSKYLKGRLACGGTVKENSIELQGNHRDRVKELLTTRGYSIDNIS